MLRGERWIVAIALVGACRPSAPPPPEPTAPVATAPSAEPKDPPEPAALPLEQRLDAHAITADDFVRLDLYTWTTPEQIEALRAGGRLLVADGREHASPFNRLLRAMVEQQRPGHEVAALLDHGEGLTKRRYAWTSPFATVLGKGPRRYGEALIRVQLSPRAIIARLDPTASPPWSFRDAAGRVISEQAVRDDPSRLGAVFHLRVDDQERSIPFREWVLCNEAMVARWSVGTPAIAARIEQERRLVQDLAAGPFAVVTPAAQSWRAWPQWIDPGPAPTLLSRWHRALAFDNERYRPTPAALARIDQALADYDPTGPALVGGTEAQASR